MKLSAAQRQALPSSAFALPGRRFPIHDEVHARQALRMKGHATPAEQALIEKKVYARYPSLRPMEKRAGLRDAGRYLAGTPQRALMTGVAAGAGLGAVGGAEAATKKGRRSRSEYDAKVWRNLSPDARRSLIHARAKVDGIRPHDEVFDHPDFQKKAQVEYRGKTFPGYNQPIASDRAGKKKMVLVKRGDRVKLVHFGQKGYRHNYSEKAKRNYLRRSAGIKGKDGRLTKDDPFSPNYWARKVLWPEGEKTAGLEKVAAGMRRLTEAEAYERLLDSARAASPGVAEPPESIRALARERVNASGFRVNDTIATDDEVWYEAAYGIPAPTRRAEQEKKAALDFAGAALRAVGAKKAGNRLIGMHLRGGDAAEKGLRRLLSTEVPGTKGIHLPGFRDKKRREAVINKASKLGRMAVEDPVAATVFAVPLPASMPAAAAIKGAKDVARRGLGIDRHSLEHPKRATLAAARLARMSSGGMSKKAGLDPMMGAIVGSLAGGPLGARATRNLGPGYQTGTSMATSLVGSAVGAEIGNRTQQRRSAKKRLKAINKVRKARGLPPLDKGTLEKTAKKHDPSKFCGKARLPLTAEDRKALADLKRRAGKSGFSAVRTAAGVAIYTHRARSPFYPSFDKIPVSRARFVDSTG